MKILISIPNEHWIHKEMIPFILKLFQDSKYQLHFIFPSFRPYENNLHHIISTFIDERQDDFWLNIDSDNPPLNNPLNLIELDKDIIGLPTPIWHFKNIKNERPFYYNAYDYVSSSDAYKEHLPQIGLQKVDAIGTGACLISRRVFIDSEMRKMPFERKKYPDGQVNKGNDISFCERARKHGYEIYCHYDYPCHHYSEIDLLCLPQAISNLGVL